tara:strand:- start:2351 stop:3157 length:807 start_codon:yes stop_codon:yes gene_type:complete
MKKLSSAWLIIRHDFYKLIYKNFSLFNPNSAGRHKSLGLFTYKSIVFSFPLILKIIESFSKIKIIKSNFFSNRNSQNNKNLKKLFNKYGSDKSKDHDYHLIYCGLFKDLKKVKKVLEIGIGTNNENLPSNMGAKGKPGASLRALRDFFKNAKIYGADIDNGILFKENKIKTFYVDQSNSKSLKNLYKKVGGNFDLIIDDGLHSIFTNLNVILHSLLKLNKKGWLIIEDIGPEKIDIWKVIYFIMKREYNCYLIKTKNNVLVFALQNIK